MFIDWHKLEKLLDGSSFNENEIDRIWHRLYHLEKIEGNEFADNEYREIEQKLYNNQLDRVTHGTNYNQTDIKNHLKKLR